VARRAINVVKDKIASMDWKIKLRRGYSNAEVPDAKQRMRTLRRCLEEPNVSDSFRTLFEQVLEDLLVGGFGAVEVEATGDELRPFHLWAVDGATIEIDVEKKLKGSPMQVALHTGKGALGLLGASGAGKSMTLRMIAGIVAPDSGYILLSGRVLYDSPTGRTLPAARRRIGVVFQDYALFPNMTVAENIGFGLSALPQEERQLRIVAQLESMHIAELAGRYPRELSGGQRQRVAIARCMATEPNALLFDEPFAALDPHLRRRMEEQLRETLAGYTGAVIFVTHDMEEAFRF